VTPARRLNPPAQATAGTTPAGWLLLAYAIWPGGEPAARSTGVDCGAAGSPQPRG